MAEEFAGILVCEQVGAWTYVPVPDEVALRLGEGARVPVSGTVNGAPLTGSIMTGPDGRYLVVNRSVRDAAGVAAGDRVRVVVDRDRAERTVEAPDDLAAALAADSTASDYFDKLSYSRRKEYVTWIEGAKREETRQRRIAQAVERLAAGRPLKG